MNVLHIGKYYPPFAGGIEHFMADLLAIQNQQGLQASALVHDHHAPGWQLLPVVSSDPDYAYPLYRSPCYGRLLYAPIAPHFIYWLQRVIQQQQPDILHLHLPNTSAFFALMLPIARAIPWVIHWHSDVVAAGFDQRLTWAYQVYRPWEQALLKRSRAVIVTSPPYLAASPALQPWRDKCQVIPLGLADTQTPKINQADHTWAKQQWQRTGLRVLHVGRMTYYKGQQNLLNALAQSPQSQLLLVGDGELKSPLQQQIQALNLTHRCRMTGFISDQRLQALFASCDCICLPSLERTEAFGMVLLEAMRYAKPAIISQLKDSGMTWVVQDQRTGCHVPINDPAALAQAFETLVQQPDLAVQWGKQAYQRLQDEFALPKLARQIEPCYQTVLNE